MGEQIVVAVPYDPEWARRFTEEAVLLEAVLAPWLDGGIHHVGSTSVPGLAAKPIVDMIAGIRHLDEARAAFEPLAAIGYRHQEHRPEAHSFHKPGAAAGWWEETHHLHLTEPGSDIWRERLAFRAALRADPELVEEYARWKAQNAAGARAGNSYLAAKDPFVRRVLAAQGIELKPAEERLSRGVVERRRAATIKITEASEETLRELASWRYPPPYDFYDGDAEPVLNPERFFEARDERADLVGFYYFEPKSPDLDYGLGLRPDLTGQGLGLEYFYAGLAFARERYRPRHVLLHVAAFNERARRVYERAGFRVVSSHGRTFEQLGEVEFLTMAEASSSSSA